MHERDVGLAIVSEPYRIPTGDPQWVGAPDGSVAMVWRRTKHPLPYTAVDSGDGFVLARWGGILLVGVYFSPRFSTADLEDRLDAISRSVRAQRPAPIIIADDFNTHSKTWGSRRTNAKGRVVLNWAAALGLMCMNRGRESTCVRAQGESIVDLTWASPQAAAGFRSWKVLTEEESLSDHVFIEFELWTALGNYQTDRGRYPARWSMKKLDPDKLIAALLISSWPTTNEEGTIEEEARSIRDEITRACDVAMPRSQPRPRKAKYWWIQEIADLRRLSIRARRSWLRARRSSSRSREE